MTAPIQPDPDTAIGDAALIAAGELTAGQLLAAVTPERVGELAGYSASSVRYRLNAATRTSQPQQQPVRASAGGGRSKGWAFDRELLLARALEACTRRAVADREVVRRRAFDALDALEQGKVTPLEQALHDAWAGLGSTQGFREARRLHLLAAASHQESPAVARALRDFERERSKTVLPILVRGLDILGREPRPGIEPAAVADAIGRQLASSAARTQSEIGERAALRAALGVLLALTRPAAHARPSPTIRQLLTTHGPEF